MTIALSAVALFGLAAVIIGIFVVRIADNPPAASLGSIIAGAGLAALAVAGIIALVRLL